MAMAQADVGKYEQKYINLLEDRLNASEKLKAQVEKSSNLSKTIDAMIQEVLALREVCFNRKISTENISSSFSAIESRAVKDLTVKEFVSEPIQQNDLVVQPRQSRQRQKQLQEQPQPQQPATISHAQTNIRHADEARETSQKKSRETRSAKKPAPAQPQPQQPITQKPSIVIRTHPIQSPNILHQCDCCTTASSSLWFEGPSACVLCANCAELMKQGKILYTPLPPDDSAQDEDYDDFDMSSPASPNPGSQLQNVPPRNQNFPNAPQHALEAPATVGPGDFLLPGLPKLIVYTSLLKAMMPEYSALPQQRKMEIKWMVAQYLAKEVGSNWGITCSVTTRENNAQKTSYGIPDFLAVKFVVYLYGELKKMHPERIVSLQQCF